MTCKATTEASDDERRPLSTGGPAGLILVGLVLAAGLAAAAPAAGAPGDAGPGDRLPAALGWPLAGYDAHGTSAVAGDVADEATVEWRKDLGSHSKASSIADGILVTGHGGDLHSLIAWNASTGEKLWTFQGASGPGQGFKDAPAIQDGVVYAGNEDGHLYAVDLETGREVWRFASEGGNKMVSSPIVKGGVVYAFDQGGRVYALDQSTGDLLWYVSTDGGITEHVVVDDTRVYVNPRGSFVYAFDASTGEQVWKQSLDAFSKREMAYDESHLFVADRDGTLYALAARTGAVDWTVETGTSRTSVEALTSSSIYAGGNGFVAVDRDRRSVAWRFDPGGSVQEALVVGDQVVLGTGGHHGVHGLDRGTGSQVWTYDPGMKGVQPQGFVDGLLHLDTGGPSGGGHIALDIGAEPAPAPGSTGGSLTTTFSDGFEDGDHQGWTRVWIDAHCAHRTDSNEADDWAVDGDTTISGQASIRLRSTCDQPKSGNMLATDGRVVDLASEGKVSLRYLYEDGSHRGGELWLLDSDSNGTQGDRIPREKVVKVGQVLNPGSGDPAYIKFFGQKKEVPKSASSPGQTHELVFDHQDGRYTLTVDGDHSFTVDASALPSNLDPDEAYRLVLTGSGHWGASSTIWYDDVEVRTRGGQRSPAPADIRVTEVSVAPTSISAGAAVTLSGTAENVGGQAGSRTLEVLLDGTVVGSVQVQVGAGETTRFSTTLAPSELGQRTLEVGSKTASLTVQEPTRAPTPTDLRARVSASVELTWNLEAEDPGPLAVRRGQGGCPAADPKVVAVVDDPSLVDRSVRPGRTYCYSVRPGGGDASTAARTTVTVPAPGSPSAAPDATVRDLREQVAALQETVDTQEALLEQKNRRMDRLEDRLEALGEDPGDVGSPDNATSEQGLVDSVLEGVGKALPGLMARPAGLGATLAVTLPVFGLVNRHRR